MINSKEDNIINSVVRSKEKDFLKKVEKSLDFSKENSGNPRNNRYNNQFLFLISGISGTGKSFLIEQIRQLANLKTQQSGEQEKDTPISLRINFNNQISSPSNPLDLLRKLNSELVDKLKKTEIKSENIIFSKNNIYSPFYVFKEQALPYLHYIYERLRDETKENERNKSTKSNEIVEIESEFSRGIKKYEELLVKLRNSPVEGKKEVDAEQLKHIEDLMKIGKEAVGLLFPATSPITSIISTVGFTLTSKLVGDSEFKDRLNKIYNIKSQLLNKHRDVCDNPSLQDLLLDPLDILTPKFISYLVEISRKVPIILIFENCERLWNSDENPSPFLDWFYKLWLSPESALFKASKENHKVRIFISSRREIKGKKYLEDLDREFSLGQAGINKTDKKDTFYFDIHLENFDKNETEIFVNNFVDKFNKSDKFSGNKDQEIDISKEEISNFYIETKGHPKYLELICGEVCDVKNKIRDSDMYLKPDHSNFGNEIADSLLENLGPHQQKMIEQISCCRWIDRDLEKFLVKRLGELDTRLDISEEIKNFQCLDWLRERNLVTLNFDKYCFDKLARQVLRRKLFQENRNKFYKIHGIIADYFKDKSKQRLRNGPDFIRYDDDEWCELIKEFLYYSCFIQPENDYTSELVCHLFAASYLRKEKFIKELFFDILYKEFSPDNHPLLHSRTQIILKKLSFIVRYGWVAFELDHTTDYGKYSHEIEQASQLCKNSLGQIEDGIGKIAILEFIIKNCHTGISYNSELTKVYEKQLHDQLEKLDDNYDPIFYSRLFLQTVCWKTSSDDEELINLCNKLLKHRSSNASAYFHKGEIFLDRAQHFCGLAKSKSLTENLEEAILLFERAIKIQPYDHRFWEARGHAWFKRATSFEEEKDIQENDLKSKIIDYPDSSKLELGDILWQSMCYQKAVESYDKTLQYYDDDILRQKKTESDSKSENLLEIYLLRKYGGKRRLESIDSQGDRKKQSDKEDRTHVQLTKDGDCLRKKAYDIAQEKEKVSKLKEAISCYEKAIYKNPEHPLGWYGRGLCYLEIGKTYEDLREESSFKKAIDDFQKALVLNEDLSWAHYDRGITYFELSIRETRRGFWDSECEQDMSINDLNGNELLKGNTISGNTSHLTKIINEKLQKALHDFDDAIRINPEYERAWYYRGLVLAKLGRHEEAIASYDRSIQITKIIQETMTKERGFSYFDRGVSYVFENKYEEAISSFKKSCKQTESRNQQNQKGIQSLNSLRAKYYETLAVLVKSDLSEIEETDNILSGLKTSIENKEIETYKIGLISIATNLYIFCLKLESPNNRQDQSNQDSYDIKSIWNSNYEECDIYLFKKILDQLVGDSKIRSFSDSLVCCLIEFGEAICRQLNDNLDNSEDSKKDSEQKKYEESSIVLFRLWPQVQRFYQANTR